MRRQAAAGRDRRGTDRRGVLAVLARGTLAIGVAGAGVTGVGVTSRGMTGAARAETPSSVDTAPLQFALNLHYLTTNFLQVVAYGADGLLGGDLIRGGEIADRPGVPAQGLLRVTFPAADRAFQARFNEMADEHRARLLLLRGFLRGDAPAQTLIDYSPETFSTMFRAAGAIAPTARFNPYASVSSALLAAETLVTVAASAQAALLPLLRDPIALPALASLAAGAANNATVLRAMLLERAATDPTVTATVDRLAAWRDRIDGTAPSDRGLSTESSAAGGVTRLTRCDGDGLYLTRTPQQALNVLFMTSAAARQGGFFPTGINGAIGASAASQA